MFNLKVFISEFLSINTFSTSTVTRSKISSLSHELGDDSVEGAVLESESLFAGAQCSEVLCGLGDHVGEQLEHHSAHLLTVVG